MVRYSAQLVRAAITRRLVFLSWLRTCHKAPALVPHFGSRKMIRQTRISAPIARSGRRTFVTQGLSNESVALWRIPFRLFAKTLLWCVRAPREMALQDLSKVCHLVPTCATGGGSTERFEPFAWRRHTSPARQIETARWCT